MFLAQFIDNGGSRRGFVADDRVANLRFEFGDDVGREAMRVNRERFFKNDAGHFPVACRRIFAGRSERAFAVRAGGMFWTVQPGNAFDVCQTQAAQVGKIHMAAAGDVAKRVAAFVAVGLGVGHSADAYTIQHNPNNALKCTH